MTSLSEPRDLATYSEDDLLVLVGVILSEPGELNEMRQACLQAINCEFQLREAKKLERYDC